MNIYQSSLMFASKARAYPNGTSYLANWLDVLGCAAQDTEESISIAAIASIFTNYNAPNFNNPYL
jgi:hypothetical protein